MPPRKKAYEGRRRAEEDAPIPGQFIQPVGPSTAPGSSTRRASKPRHAKPDPPKAPAAAKTAPRKATARTKAPPAVTKRPPSSVAEDRNRAVTEEGRDYAYRAALRAGQGKPSTVGRAVSGGAAGAAAGAALGGPPGAAVGGVVGGAGGALAGRQAAKAYKAATRTNGQIRRWIVIEFAVCITIVALSPLTDKHKTDTGGAFMKRMTAVMGLFFVLALLSAGGRGLARAAAGLGGLVTVVLAVSERNLFTKIGQIVGSGRERGISGEGGQFGETAGAGAIDAIEAGRVGERVEDPDGRVGRRVETALNFAERTERGD
jgi:hypothetical protein